MSTYRNFHSGEAQLQAESGIDTEAYDLNVDQPFRPELNASEVKFVGERTFSVAASLDLDGRPWASPLVGEPGELFTVEDLTTVRVRPRPVEGDPLYENIESMGELGILYFNPSIRRRAKSLGRGTIEEDGSITYRMTRMFGLCPKYIFKRAHDVGGRPGAADDQAKASVSSRLSDADREQLGSADTIFLASHSEQHGTDPTHRGGPPGFVTVVDDATLLIPEYVGNGMFQTMGNLLLDDRLGVMSVDFATGRILQLTGRGTIRSVASAGRAPERALAITIDEVRSGFAAIGTWADIESFDFGAIDSSPAR